MAASTVRTRQTASQHTSQAARPRPYVRGALGMCLIVFGIAVAAVAAGRWALLQHAGAPARWDLVAFQAAGGGALALTGFSVLVAATPEIGDDDAVVADPLRESAAKVCTTCDAINDLDARFCDQCGVRMG